MIDQKWPIEIDDLPIYLLKNGEKSNSLRELFDERYARWGWVKTNKLPHDWGTNRHKSQLL